MTSIDFNERIPNNVNLGEDRALKRALEHWQPNYLSWWQDMGPEESQDFDVYLRTAISVDQEGWAQFDFVKMPDYRWGIFLNPAEADRKIDQLAASREQDVEERALAALSVSLPAGEHATGLARVAWCHAKRRWPQYRGHR